MERILDGKSVVIKFINWKKDSTNRVTYNFKSPQDKTPFFFSLDSTTFANSCSEYTYVGNWDITFGTFTTPFKFRHNPLLFTNNLNLGTSICFQVKKGPNWSLGFVGGLSLSSITLDNFSTKGAVPSSTERPAVTPSLNLMIGYKNINLMFGLGWDYINKTSPLEESWIYNGKHWVGVGVGISLFNSNPATASTVKAEGQKTP